MYTPISLLLYAGKGAVRTLLSYWSLALEASAFPITDLKPGTLKEIEFKTFFSVMLVFKSVLPLFS